MEIYFCQEEAQGVAILEELLCQAAATAILSKKERVKMFTLEEVNNRKE